MELERLRGWLDEELPVGDDYICTTVGELGSDVFVGIGSIVRLNDDRVRTANSGGMDWEEGFELGLGGVQTGRVGGSVGCHCEVELPKGVEGGLND